jgi:hypothetical protein
MSSKSLGSRGVTSPRSAGSAELSTFPGSGEAVPAIRLRRLSVQRSTFRGDEITSEREPT